MKNCREFEPLIDRAQAGEASEEEREALLDHIESCSDCSDVFEAIGRLRHADLHPEPTEEDLLSMRRAVIREIRHKRSHRESQKDFSAVSFFMHPASLAVTALVILAIGYFLGAGFKVINIDKGEAQIAASPDQFMSTIKTVAQSHDAYEDIMNSPFTYSNVRLIEGEAGMVNLSFDVSRSLDLSLRKDDPLLTEVLVQSLIEPSGVDTRLMAISVTQNVLDPKIKKSLILAMLNDETLAVRMTAQSKLTEISGDSEVNDAFLTVLEREPSVRMRLVAIDYLTNSSIQPARLEQAITAGKPEGSNAVLVKASQYLNQ